MKDSGPAFPIFSDSAPHGGNAVWGGMSLRDYFAAKAMQGMLAAYPHEQNPRDVSCDAYRHADAMLKAREENK